MGWDAKIFAGLILVAIGLGTILLRRTIIFVLVGIEIAVNGILLVFFSSAVGKGFESAGALILIIVAIAAAEAALGLALAVAVFRTIRSADVDELSKLRG